MPALLRRTRAIWRCPSKKPTEETFLKEPATTESLARLGRHAFLFGEIHVIVGRLTTSIRMPRNREFGIGFTPSVWMFFVSWLSEANTRMNSGPASIGLESLG